MIRAIQYTSLTVKKIQNLIQHSSWLTWLSNEKEFRPSIEMSLTTRVGTCKTRLTVLTMIVILSVVFFMVQLCSGNVLIRVCNTSQYKRVVEDTCSSVYKRGRNSNIILNSYGYHRQATYNYPAYNTPYYNRRRMRRKRNDNHIHRLT